MSLLQAQVEELVAANRRKDEELSKVRLKAERDVDAIDRELRATRLDNERKDKRLDVKQRKIEALQKDVDDERRRREIATKGETKSRICFIVCQK